MDNKIISYLTFRKVIGILGMLLAPICVIGGVITTGTMEHSISAYYNTVMRDVMVGVLVTSGAFLMAYKGYDLKDNLVSWVSGVSVVGVALFSLNTPIAHTVFAAIFFLSIAYMSSFQFTLGSDKHKNIIYRSCSITILIAIILIPLLSFPSSTLILETIMMLAFGIAWLTKGISLK